MTAWTIRLALACYALALALDLANGLDQRKRRAIGWVWTAGCVFLWAHIAAALQFHHHGSLAHAAAETARRTAEVIGWSWGGEIHVNFAFAAVWTGDAMWRGIARESHRRRPVAISAIVHAFLFFIAFNATVVFEDGPIRAAGIAASLALAILLAVRLRRGWRRPDPVPARLGMRRKFDSIG